MRNARFLAALVVCAVALSCGSDEAAPPAPPPDSGVSLFFAVSPLGSTGGRLLLPSTVIEIQDVFGKRVLDSTRRVRIELIASTGNPDATLTGTLAHNAVNGRATFSDLVIDLVGTSYRLQAFSSGLMIAQSSAFNIGLGKIDLIGFRQQPSESTLGLPVAPAIIVELQDKGGNLVTSSSDWVTLTIEANPGSQLLHWSQRTLDLVDLLTGTQGATLANRASAEGLALTLDHTGKFAWGTAADLWLYSFDLQSGKETAAARTGLMITGLAFATNGLLYAVSRDTPDLYMLFTTTGNPTSLGTVTIAGDVITGFMGLARDPETDTLFAVVEMESAGGTQPSGRLVRHLITIDTVSFSATMIGQLPEDGVADLAFDANGQLFAVTGDGAPTPETVFRVDKTTAAMVGHVVLGDGIDGETIAWIPTQLSGTVSVPSFSGVATFDNLVVTSPGGGFTLHAQSTSGGVGTSSKFNVLP